MCLLYMKKISLGASLVFHILVNVSYVLSDLGVLNLVIIDDIVSLVFVLCI